MRDQTFQSAEIFRVNKHSKNVDLKLPKKLTETCLLSDSLLSTLLHVSASASSRKASGFIFISGLPVVHSLTISLYMKAISFSQTKSPLLSPCVESSACALSSRDYLNIRQCYPQQDFLALLIPTQLSKSQNKPLRPSSVEAHICTLMSFISHT